jgi:hypothetical protein
MFPGKTVIFSKIETSLVQSPLAAGSSTTTGENQPCQAEPTLSGVLKNDKENGTRFGDLNRDYASL